MVAVKRSADEAPEVDLGECTLHSPLQKVNKAELTLALESRNPKQMYQWSCEPLSSGAEIKGAHLASGSYLRFPPFKLLLGAGSHLPPDPCPDLRCELHSSIWNSCKTLAQPITTYFSR